MISQVIEEETNMLVLDKVHKGYASGNRAAPYTPVLKGVDLTVEKGEFVMIMGPSGCGKSTLLYILGTLTMPTKGHYKINEQDVSKLSEKDRERLRLGHFGFIFQNYRLFPLKTVAENIEFPMAFMKTPKVARLTKTGMLLRRVGLEEKAKAFPDRLSGGQQQRVAIARALANDPEVILADEPTGNLDEATTHEIMELLRQLNEKGVTIVMVTHDTALTKYATSVYTLNNGILSLTSAATSVV
jgi:putative ABC transport system ATP-binding protein